MGSDTLNNSFLMSFSLAIISFINSFCDFILDFLCLVGFVASCGIGSSVGSRVGILCKFFIVNNLLINY